MAGQEIFDEVIDRRGTNSYKWDHAGGEDVIPMWVADMDFRTAPCIVDALRRRVGHGIFGYVAVPQSSYETVVGWFGSQHGWDIAPEWIQYTSGVVPAVSAVIKALTMPGDRVAVLTPAYNCFFSSIRNNGCQVEECPLVYEANTYHIDFEDLERRLALTDVKVLLFCNPHNPAGRVWTRRELTQVVELCHRHGVVIVSDEIHCELVMPGHRFTPLASVSQQAQQITITCNSPSKSFNIAGLQIANIITPHALWRDRIDRAININEVCDVNPFGVEALQAAYSPVGARWLDELNTYLHSNYEALRAHFAEHLPHLPVTTLEGTYLVWVNITPLGHGSDHVAGRLLRDARVAVNSGTMYGASGEGFIRLNIALPRTRMLEALARITPVLKRDEN